MNAAKGSKTTNLLKQAIWRVLLAMATFMVIIAGLALWFQQSAMEKGLRTERAVLHNFYLERIVELEQDWQTHAVDLKNDLEFWRIMEMATNRWNTLRSFLIAHNEALVFRAVIITDKEGQVLFQHGVDRSEIIEQTSLAPSGWVFDDKAAKLMRYYVQPLWLGQEDGAGRLIVFRPLDNALLRQNSFPYTDLFITWKGTVVARSQENVRIPLIASRAIEEIDGQIYQQTSIPWDEQGSETPVLLIQRKAPQFITNDEILTVAIGAVVAMTMFLLGPLGLWLFGVTHRIVRLGDTARAFTHDGQWTPLLQNDLQEIGRRKEDEISFVAHALEDLAQTVIERDQQRHIHEMQLRESEAKMREITAMIADGLFVIDAEGAVTFFNTQGERLLGWKEADLLGKNSHEAFHSRRLDGSHNPMEGCPIRKTIETGQPYRSYEDYFVCKDGSLLPVAIASAPIIRDGLVVGAVITFEDHSERILAEKILKESEERFRNLFNGVRDAIFVIALLPQGGFGRFLEVNSVACQRYGYSREEFLTMTPLEINTPEGRQDLPAIAARIHSAQQAVFERLHVARDGRRIPVEVNSQLVEFQGEPATLSMVRDITDRKRAEEVLRENEERFRAMAHSLRDAILVFDSKGTIDFLNRGGEIMFGYTESDILDHPVSRLFPKRLGAPPWKEKLHLFAERPWENLALTMEGVAIRSTGDEFPVEISLTAWTQRGEQLYSAAIRDISDRRLLENRDLRAYVNRIAISALLEIGLEPLPLVRKLEVALEIILTVPWLALQSKGSIFLTTPEGDLDLVVQRGLAKHLLQACKRIPMGYCLCGRAAQSRELIFANQIDERHDVLFEGIQPHGHYCIPIISRVELLGVLNLYVDAGHPHDPEENAFLSTIANTLAGLIERGLVEEKIQHMASHDQLTGLPNRRLFHEHLDKELKHAIRVKRPLAVAFLDLDHFKAVNDTLGHEAGDILLKTVTMRLQQCLRESDTLARLGGDEFTLILPAIDTASNAAMVAEKIIQALEEPFVIFDSPCQIGVSIGVSLFPEDGATAELLLQRADQAMYGVKNSGRNGVAFFGDTNKQ